MPHTVAVQCISGPYLSEQLSLTYLGHILSLNDSMIMNDDEDGQAALMIMGKSVLMMMNGNVITNDDD